MKPPRELYCNTPRTQEPRTFTDYLKATFILEYLGIPTFLIIFRRIK